MNPNKCISSEGGGCSERRFAFLSKRTNTMFLLGAVVLFGSVQPAYAYLDPGTSSIIIQMLLGGAAGAAVVGKLYWSKIKTFCGQIFASGKKSDTNPPRT